MEKNVYKLGSVCLKIGSGATPTGGKEAYKGGGYKLIRSQNVIDLRFSYDGLAEINKEQAIKLNNVQVEANDVLLNITGDSVARCCMAPAKILPARVNQHVSIIRPNSSLLNPYYLLFWLIVNKQYLLALAATGATRNALTKSMIKGLVVECPSIERQHRIASILSTYDTLIENNTKRIRLLEKMAENLYKEWFSYNKIKKEGCIVRLTDVVQITRGLSYSSEEIDCEEGLDLINLKNIQAYGGFRYDGTKKYCGKYKDVQIVHEGDLVMGVTDMTQDRRTVGSVALIPHTDKLSVISADLIKITSDISNVFLFGMFKYGNVSKYIAQFANGANVLHLRPKALHNIKILLPKSDLINKYVDIVSPMFAEKNKLYVLSDKLARQRDLLLPRLMSGKLEVKEELLE